MKRAGYLNISAQQLRKNIKDKLFYNTEGIKKTDLCKFKEAVEFFTKAIELTPKDSASYFNRATAKMDLGDIPGAQLDFELSESF